MYISFFCRPSKQLQNGLSPIEVSVTIGKERRVIRLPKYVRAEDFNVKKQRVKRNEVLNRYLDAVKVKFTQIETEMLKCLILKKVDVFRTTKLSTLWI